MSTAVVRFIDELRDRGGLKGRDIANIFDSSPPTVSRWATGKATPPLEKQTIMADLRFVVDRLSDYYTADETRVWLHSKHPMLNQQRAIDLITAGQSEEVLAVIDRLDSDSFV